MSAGETRLRPATSVIHLEWNAGEDADIRVTVRDAAGVGVPLQSAVGTIALPRSSTALHTFSAAEGNLALADQTDPVTWGVLILSASAADTLAWQAWTDAEWQLDAVDIFGRSKRACEGDVRVIPSRRPA